MKYKILFMCLPALASITKLRCLQKPKGKVNTRFTNDSAKVLVDESFKPYC